MKWMERTLYLLWMCAAAAAAVLSKEKPYTGQKKKNLSFHTDHFSVLPIPILAHTHAHTSHLNK